MKKIILEVIFYIISIALQILPVIVGYNYNMFVPPLYFMIIVSFYLLAGSIYFSIKNNSFINIWRVFPCLISLFIGHRFIVFIEDYFLNIGEVQDLTTYLVLNYFYIISAWIVIAGIVIYQVITLINYFYKHSKENNKSEN